jgi:hypothetical protein
MKSIIWENKGIVLGIIIYILNNYNKLKDKKIIIRNERYKFILERLFLSMEFRFHTDEEPNKNIFEINIRNNNKRGLIINNINNLEKIQGIPALLPWYDKYNPIVMFFYNEKKSKHREKILYKINKFSVEERLEPYGPINFIEVLCKIRIWDTHFEHYVLEMLRRKFGYSKVSTYEFISNVLTEKPCGEVTPVIKYPVIYERIVKQPIPIIYTLIKEVEKEISDAQKKVAPICTCKPDKIVTPTGLTIEPVVKPTVEPTDKCNCKEYQDLIDILNKKLEILNSIFNEKKLEQQ